MKLDVLGVKILFLKKKRLKNLIYNYKGKANYICFPNANVIIEANDNNEYKNVINNSLFNICDGTAPMLYARIKYKINVEKYPGPDFFMDVLKDNNRFMKHFFLGSTEEVLLKLKDNLNIYNSTIVGHYSPPFLKVEEFNYKYIAKMINSSGANLVWVSLGAPKQELFMSRLVNFLNDDILCLGVGAAFDFYAGRIKRAPKFMQKIGMEWLYRIYKEPQRLFKRYMYVNTEFIYKSIYEILKKG